jgi:hypothetical protein
MKLLKGRGNSDATVAAKGLQVYLVEGFSVRFMAELGKFGKYLWNKYCKDIIDPEEYVDMLNSKVWYLLYNGVYDPSKANLTTFIHSTGRNIASLLVSKFSRVNDYDIGDSDVAYAAPVEVDEICLEEFIALVIERGMIIDREALIHDIVYKCDNPVSNAYLWYAGSHG